MVNTLATVSKDRIQEYLNKPDAYGTCLLAIVLDNYGLDPFAWEPSSIRYQLKQDFGVDVSRLNMEKILALITVLTTNQFNLSWEIFSQTCQVLNGEPADFTIFSPIDPEDLAWGVTEAILNDPPRQEAGNDDFSHEVKRYAGLVLSQNGIWQPPKFLSFAEMPVDPSLDLETVFEDTDVFEAARQNQMIRQQELETYVQVKMRQLLIELDNLPLLNRASHIQSVKQNVPA